jgi:hypothetical protein
MVVSDEPTVEDRLAELEHRLMDLEQFLIEVASDFLTRCGVAEANDEAIV